MISQSRSSLRTVNSYYFFYFELYFKKNLVRLALSNKLLTMLKSSYSSIFNIKFGSITGLSVTIELKVLVNCNIYSYV